MKQLIIAAFLLVSGIAQAQVVPLYGEVYKIQGDRTIGLEYKQWVAANGNARQEDASKGRVTSANIFRRDSAKAYILDLTKKTYMAMPFSYSTGESPLNSIAGMKVEEGRNTKRDYLGDELVEGKMCKHYRITQTSSPASGRAEGTTWDEWIYPPINAWLQTTQGCDPGYALVLRNMVMGDQPAHLFEIPKDFKERALPGDILNQFMKSKGSAEIDGAKQKEKELDAKLKGLNDPKKSQEQQMQDAMKMLGDALNKDKNKKK